MLRARHGADPREFGAMDMDVYLDDKSRRPHYIRKMFDVIAPGYDAFTKYFSFGMDQQWKRSLVAETAKHSTKHPVLVDLACGTGDLALELFKHVKPRLAVGVDTSLQMLILNQARTHGQLHLAAGDIVNLGLNDHSADVVTIGYGLRNTSDLTQGLREIARVLKPGGILANLDFYCPTGELWPHVYLTYMHNFGRLAGWVWHREPSTYGYIAASIRRYVTLAQFEEALKQAGFEIKWSRQHLGGAIGMHVAKARGNGRTGSGF